MNHHISNRILLCGTIGAAGLLASRAVRRSWRRFDLRGRSVLTTGGSRGLGLILARKMTERGARVAVCARNSEELEFASADIARFGSQPLTLPCDVTNPQSVREMVAACNRAFGQIDVLINNATAARSDHGQRTFWIDIRQPCKRNKCWRKRAFRDEVKRKRF